VLRDQSAERARKAQALKFVVHFMGDLHQPLHDEDKTDRAGNATQVIFDGKPDNLHWVWDTAMLEHIDRNPQDFAARLEANITDRDQAAWVEGSIEDWALEGHRLAPAVAYGDLGKQNPAIIDAAYGEKADPAIEAQIEKAGCAWPSSLTKLCASAPTDYSIHMREKSEAEASHILPNSAVQKPV